MEKYILLFLIANCIATLTNIVMTARFSKIIERKPINVYLESRGREDERNNKY